MLGGLMKQKERQKQNFLQGTRTMEKNAYAQKLKQPAGADMPGGGAFPEEGGASFVSVPKAARKKRVRGGKKLKRENFGEGAAGATPVADAVKEQHSEAWTDLTEAERETESVKKDREYWESLREDLNFYAKDDMAPMNEVRDAEKGEMQKKFEFSSLSQNVQDIIKSVADATEKPKQDETVKERKARFAKEEDTVKKLYEIMTHIREEQAGKTVTDAAYNALTLQEKEILSTYAVRFLYLYRGSLEVDASTKIDVDMTAQDDLFKIPEKKYPKPLDQGTWSVEKKEYFMKDYTKQPLFTHEPNTFDVRQGDIGDCYMLTGLNALLLKDPEFIKDCMKDEGDTVAVRFYKGPGQPFFVRVKKTLVEGRYVGKDKATGNTVTSKRSVSVGARDVFWVRMFEKAFAAARQYLDPQGVQNAKQREKNPNLDLMHQIAGGNSGEFIQLLTGKYMEMQYVPGYDEYTHQDHRFAKRYNLSELLADMEKKEKARYKNEIKEGNKNEKDKKKQKKFTEEGWTARKAMAYFGVDITGLSDQAKNDFKNNEYIIEYGRFMQKHLSNFEQDDFHSILDADYFLSTIEWDKLPKINVPGLDDEKMKVHFIKYFRNFIRTESKLKNTINRTGQYEKQETAVFKEIEDALTSKKIVTASTGDLSFVQKKNNGLNGEKTVQGIAGTHAYAVLGVKTKDEVVNGKTVTHRFIVLQNPWAEKIRLYDKDTGLPYYANKKDAQGQADNHGVFEMELRDFLNTFRRYMIND